MEELISYQEKISVDHQLLKTCNINVLSIEDFNVFKCSKTFEWKLQLKLNIEYDFLYDRLYIGKYDQVPDHLKEMFLLLSFLKAFTIISRNENNLEELIEAIKLLDVGIMIGCGLNQCDLISEFTQKLHECTIQSHPIPLIDSNFSTHTDTKNETASDIDVIDDPSIEHFWTKYFHLHQPTKLQNCISHWPAISKWNDLNYFIKVAGYRTVPIELGKAYDDDNWGQSMFRLKDFLRLCADKNSTTKAYLAQHDLFEQIPLLKNDFCTPDYCAISSQEPIVKSWIGPKNTISTMHTDDKHNLLCQVVGEKLIILASPRETENLYPYEGMLNNTTQIDAENVDFDKYPLAKNVKFLRIVLRAGEMLYIPKLWWHYVRSLSPSVSVSFWFNAETE